MSLRGGRQLDEATPGFEEIASLRSQRHNKKKHMKPFKGFTDSESFTQLPDTFFHQLLHQIDDAAELKVTLYFLWRVEHMDGSFRALRETDFGAQELGLSADEIHSG
jgi:hypothetical protein